MRPRLGSFLLAVLALRQVCSQPGTGGTAGKGGSTFFGDTTKGQDTSYNASVCPPLPPLDGKLIWEYESKKHSNMQLSSKEVNSGNRTKLLDANWTGHYALEFGDGECASLMIYDSKGTSLLWKELTMPQGAVWKITVQIKNSNTKAFMGLINGQTVVFTCAAMVEPLFETVRKSRMSPTPHDVVLGPPSEKGEWVNLVTYIRMDYAQANDLIVIAPSSGGRGLYAVGLVRVEQVDASVCDTLAADDDPSNNCNGLKDCSDYSASNADQLKNKPYRPFTFPEPCLSEELLGSLFKPEPQPLVVNGENVTVTFGGVVQSDALNQVTVFISQIITNEVIGIRTDYMQGMEDMQSVVGKMAGLNITKERRGHSKLLSIQQAIEEGANWIDPSAWPQVLVAMPVEPNEVSEAIAELPEERLIQVEQVGSITANAFTSLWVTNAAVKDAAADGISLESWRTLSRNNQSHKYFSSPGSFASSGLDYSAEFICEQTEGEESEESKILSKAGYKCWSEGWWAAPWAPSKEEVSKGKKSTVYECIPVLMWESGLELANLLEVLVSTQIPVCMSKTTLRFDVVIQMAKVNFLTWQPYPQKADTAYVTMVDMPAKHVPFRAPFKKIIWSRLRSMNGAGQQFFYFTQRLDFAGQDVDQILANVRSNRTAKPGESDETRHYREACRWVRDNVKTWRPWLDVTCLQGFTNDPENPAFCNPCPKGTFKPLAGDMQCQQCPKGKAVDSMGSSACIDCVEGHFAATQGMEVCERCAKGVFAASLGSTSCENCADIRLHSTTDFMGATSQGDCRCPQGQFSVQDYDQAATDECRPCPHGVECPGHSEAGKPGEVLLPGFYASPLNPLESVWKCMSKEACVGQSEHGEDPCAPGRIGLNCGLCDEGMFTRGGHSGDCVKCGGEAWLLPLALVVFFLLSGCLHWFWNYRAQFVEAGESVLASVTIGVTLTFMQQIGIFDKMQFGWPDEFLAFTRIFKVFLFDIKILSPSCLIKESLASSYLGRLSVPLVLVAIFFCWYFLSKGLHAVWKRMPLFGVNGLLNSVGMITQALYISLVTSSVSLVECYGNPPEYDKTAIRSYPYVECGSSEYLAMIPFMILAILVYVAGIFALLCWLAYVAPQRMDDKGFKERTRFLVFKYQASKWWFGQVLLLRSLALAMVTVLVPTDGYRQFLLMLFILVASVFLHLNYLPYQDFYANMLETVELCLLISILGLGSWFIPIEDRQEDDATNNMMMSLILVCVGACIVVLLGVFFFAVYLAMNPLKGKAMQDRDVNKLLPKLKPAVASLAACSDDELRDLLDHSTYIDMFYLKEISNFILLEVQGLQSDKLSERRLTKKALAYSVANAEAVQQAHSNASLQLRRSVSSLDVDAPEAPDIESIEKASNGTQDITL